MLEKLLYEYSYIALCSIGGRKLFAERVVIFHEVKEHRILLHQLIVLKGRQSGSRNSLPCANFLCTTKVARKKNGVGNSCSSYLVQEKIAFVSDVSRTN